MKLELAVSVTNKKYFVVEMVHSNQVLTDFQFVLLVGFSTFHFFLRFMPSFTKMSSSFTPIPMGGGGGMPPPGGGGGPGGRMPPGGGGGGGGAIPPGPGGGGGGGGGGGAPPMPGPGGGGGGGGGGGPPIEEPPPVCICCDGLPMTRPGGTISFVGDPPPDLEKKKLKESLVFELIWVSGLL